MLSIIICSVSPERLQRVSQNMHDTIGVEHEIIAIDNREKHWPIARAYNEGARQAHYPYLFFVHEDVMFHSLNWGMAIEKKLKEPDCGAIGFAGSKVMFNCFSGWMQHLRFACTFYYQRCGGLTRFSVFNVVLEHPFEEVVVLDGLGIFVRKDVWELYPFDEKMLTGFHCYDVDFSLQISAGRKFKNYVCCSTNVLIEHFSEGDYNRGWCQDTIRMYNQKWSQILPLKASDFDLSKKEIRKYTEKSFNRFVRKSMKIDYPEKKAVLRAFLAYPFSLEHFGHCISVLCKYLKS